MTHGDFYSGPDRYDPGTLQEHKWENALTIDRQSWGYRRDISIADIMGMDELIKKASFLFPSYHFIPGK